MIVEPNTISAKLPVPVPQPKSEGGNGRSESVKAAPDPDATASLAAEVADVQNDLQMSSDVDLNFSVNQGSGDVVVTVRDGSTGKVIREIPPEEMRNLASKIDQMAGLILDRKI